MNPATLPVRKSIRLPQERYREGYVFFITITTHHRHRWFAHYPDLTNEATDLLLDLVSERRTDLYAWCFMPDHLHLLIRDLDVVAFVRRFKGALTPLARRRQPTCRLWQRSFYDHALRSEEDMHRVAAYVWENPVRAEMAASPADYRWSGSTVWPGWRAHYPAPPP